METGFHFVYEHQRVVPLRDRLGQAKDGAFSGGHLQLRVLLTAVLRRVEQGTAIERQVHDLRVVKRQHRLRELDLRGRESGFRRRGLGPGTAEDAPHLRRVGEVGESAQVHRTARLFRAPPAEETAVPALGEAPSHRQVSAGRGVVVLDHDLALRVRALPGLGAIGREERRRDELPQSGARNPVRGGRGGQHRGLPGGVTPRDDGHRVRESDAEIGDAVDPRETHFAEVMPIMRRLSLKGVPQVDRRRTEHRHSPRPRPRDEVHSVGGRSSSRSSR